MNCSRCETKVSQFQNNTTWCKLCHQKYMREHYQNNKQYYKDKAAKRNALVIAENRQFIKNYLRSHPCVDCGNTDIEVLQFDHREQVTKTTEVGRLLSYSHKRLIEEIEKCDVRCANCHIKRTRRQLGWWTDDLAVSPLATNELKG